MHGFSETQMPQPDEPLYSHRAVFAELLEIEAAKNWPCRQARIPKTLRFDPQTSSTSGLFVAKFTKLGA